MCRATQKHFFFFLFNECRELKKKKNSIKNNQNETESKYINCFKNKGKRRKQNSNYKVKNNEKEATSFQTLWQNSLKQKLHFLFFFPLSSPPFFFFLLSFFFFLPFYVLFLNEKISMKRIPRFLFWKIENTLKKKKIYIYI